MRTNKVIREVSRGLTNDWKPIFEYLMSAQFSKSEVQSEVQKIERQNRPLMQVGGKMVLNVIYLFIYLFIFECLE